MPDRRPIVANTALVAAFAVIAHSAWLYSLNTRVNEFVGLQSDKAIDNISPLAIYLYFYSAWGGTAFFTFFAVWLCVAQHDQFRQRFPAPFIWWLAVVSFAIYLPTVLFLLSAIGLWALFTPETKKLIYTLPQRRLERPNDQDVSKP